MESKEQRKTDDHPSAKNADSRQNNDGKFTRSNVSRKFKKAQVKRFKRINRCRESKSKALIAFIESNDDYENIYIDANDLDSQDGLISDVEFNNHIAEKNAARAEKEKDTKNEEFVFTMDLESVLLSPTSNVSAMYYKTKLIVHNFTIYHMRSHCGYCFVWNESEGCITANEFTTFVTNFIENIVQQHGDKVEK